MATDAAPRERFTEVQRQLAAVNEDRDGADDRLAGLLAEERELLREHGAEWERPLRAAIPGLARVFFSDGMPHNLLLDAAQFPDAGAVLPTVAPTVRYLTLDLANLVPGLAAEVFALPVLASLEGLSLKGPWGTAGARALAASKHVGNLTTLDLSYCEIGPAGVAAVLASIAIASVGEIDLSGNRIGFDGATAIAAVKQFPPALRVLHLGDADLHDGAVALLAAAPAFRLLGELWLNDNAVSAAGAAELRRTLRNTAVHTGTENTGGDRRG